MSVGVGMYADEGLAPASSFPVVCAANHNWLEAEHLSWEYYVQFGSSVPVYVYLREFVSFYFIGLQILTNNFATLLSITTRLSTQLFRIFTGCQEC